MVRLFSILALILFSSANYAAEIIRIHNFDRAVEVGWQEDAQLYLFGERFDDFEDSLFNSTTSFLSKHPKWNFIVLDTLEYVTSYNDQERDFNYVKNKLNLVWRNDEFYTPTTGSVSDRSYLLLVVKERKLLFNSSEFLSDAGLSDKRTWNGNYDRYGINPLKSALQKGNSSSFSGLLDVAVKALPDIAQGVIPAYEDSAKDVIHQLENRISQLKGKVTSVESLFSSAEFNFSAKDSLSQIEEAKSALEERDIKEAREILNLVESDLNDEATFIQSWLSFKGKLPSYEADLKHLQDSPYLGEFEDEFSELNTLLDESTDNHEIKDRYFMVKISRFENLRDHVNDRIEFLEVQAQKEKALLEKRARLKKIQLLVLAVIVLILAGIIITLFVKRWIEANRKARELLETRKDLMSHNEGLANMLVGQNRSLFSSDSELGNFGGETKETKEVYLKTSQLTLAMISSASRVLGPV